MKKYVNCTIYWKLIVSQDIEVTSMWHCTKMPRKNSKMGTKSVYKPRNGTWNWLLKLIFINVVLGFIIRLCTYCYKKNKDYPWPWFKYICSKSTLGLSSILNITKTVEKTIQKYNWDVSGGKVILFFLNHGMYCLIFGSENYWFSTTLFMLTIFWYCIRTSPSQ